jgi:hypothetical protein
LVLPMTFDWFNQYMIRALTEDQILSQHKAAACTAERES